MPIRISTEALRLIFVATIALSTLMTLIPASGLTGGEANMPLTVLASVELVAITGFAFESWRRLAAVLLVLVFAVVFVATAVFEGDFAPRFFLYSACAIFLQGPAAKADRKEPKFA